MEFDKLLTNTGYLFLILNTLLFIVSYHKKDKALKYFILYLILCLIVQIYSHYLSNLKEHNLFLSHYFFIGQFIFLSFFFSTLFRFLKFKNLHLILTFTVAITFAIYLFYSPLAYEKWNVLEIGITSIPLIVYSFFFFLKKIDDNSDKKYIYFISGFFLYTLCSTLIFTTGNIGTKSVKLIVWQINNSLYLIFQLLIFVEWYKNFRKPLPLTSKSSY